MTAAWMREEYAIATFLGVACLYPYNALLNAIPHFEEVFGPDIAYVLALALTWPTLLAQVGMLSIGRWVDSKHRIRGALILQGAVFLILPVATSRAAGIALFAASGFATAILEPSLFGFFSAFPPVFNGAISWGEATAGVGASVLQIAILLEGRRTPSQAGTLYFGIGSLGMLLAVGAHAQLLRYPFAVSARIAEAAAAEGRRDPSPSLQAKLEAQSPELAPTPPYAGSPALLLAGGGGADAAWRHTGSGLALPTVVVAVASSAEPGEAGPAVFLATERRVFASISVPALAVLANFFVTFLPFPGVVASIPYRGDIRVPLLPPLGTGGWFWLLLLLVFGVMDVVARLVASVHGAMSDRALAAYAVSRFAFVPLLVAASTAQGGPLASDAAVVILVALLAFTNGHLSCVCFMHGPKRVGAADSELAAFMMVACLHVGIVSASNVAYLFFAA